MPIRFPPIETLALFVILDPGSIPQARTVTLFPRMFAGVPCRCVIEPDRLK